MPGLVFGVVFIIVCISMLSFVWIWMAIDCVLNKRISDTEKALWVILIICTHFIGALIYFAVRRSKQVQPYHYYVPPRPQASYQKYDMPRETSYQSYQQGYQAAPQPPASSHDHDNAAPQLPVESERVQSQQLPHDYEQPQAMYPQNPYEE